MSAGDRPVNFKGVKKLRFKLSDDGNTIIGKFDRDMTLEETRDFLLSRIMKDDQNFGGGTIAAVGVYANLEEEWPVTLFTDIPEEIEAGAWLKKIVLVAAGKREPLMIIRCQQESYWWVQSINVKHTQLWRVINLVDTIINRRQQIAV